MGAFFHQLKTPIEQITRTPEQQQKSFNVIYKQAKRDAFNRAIYVLHKNWENYENTRKNGNNKWPKIEWPDETKYDPNPTYVNITTPEYRGGRKKKTRKKRKKRRRKKTSRKRKKRRRKKTRKRRRRTRRKR